MYGKGVWVLIPRHCMALLSEASTLRVGSGCSEMLENVLHFCERKMCCLLQRALKQDNSDDEDGMDPEMAMMMGFGGFGGSKK